MKKPSKIKPVKAWVNEEQIKSEGVLCLFKFERLARMLYGDKAVQVEIRPLTTTKHRRGDGKKG